MANGKPQRPKRKMINEAIAIEDGELLSQFLVRLNKLDVGQGTFRLKLDSGCACCYEPPEIEFHYQRAETDEEFESRIKSYKKRLAKWKAKNEGK